MMKAVHASEEETAENRKQMGYEKYELEDAARTLQRAEEIKADPKLMDALAPYLEKGIKSLKGLRKLAAKRISEGR